MSNSLVRTSLELFGYENSLNQDKKKKRKNKSKGALDLIPLNHRIITKASKKEKISLGRSSKLTVHEAKKHLESHEDPTEENVKRLLLLSSNRIDSETAEKLLNRALKKSYIPAKVKPPVPQTTAFTEEDFKKFEEEYLSEL